MTIHQRHYYDDPAPASTVPWSRSALDRAMAARDFERAALILLVRAMNAVDAGTIDDVIAVLTESEAFDDTGA